MSGASVSLSQAVINHFLRRISQPVPASTYLALFVADPTDSFVTANEVNGSWYARQEIPSWSAPTGAGKATTNIPQISFPKVSGGAVTVSYWGIVDASARGAGNLLVSFAFATPVTLNVDSVLTINPGDLSIALSS